MPYTKRGSQHWGSDLYVFKAGLYCKIGRSYDPGRRAKEISSACPFPVEIAGIFPGQGSREGAVHKHFDSKRTHNEWFEVDCASVLVHIAQLCHDLPLSQEAEEEVGQKALCQG